MKTKTKRIPEVRRAKARNIGYVRVDGKMKYLAGRYTEDGIDDELKASYKQFKKEFLARENTPAGSNTIAEVLKAYATHLIEKSSNVKGNQDRIEKAAEEARATIRLLAEAFHPYMGDHPSSLTVLTYNTIREGWANDRDLTTTTLKRYFSAVRCFIKYGVSRGLMPLDCKTAVDSLADITTSEYPNLKEPEIRDAVCIEDVKATLPHLNPMVNVMVQVLMATGMRPGELCNMQWTAIDTSEEVWKYNPEFHKMDHKGKTRVIYLRQDVQTLLSRWQSMRPTPNTDVLFTTKESWILGRSKNFPQTSMQTWIDASGKYPATGLRTRVFRENVKRGCAAAQIDHWIPYQCRHFFAYHMLSVVSELFATGTKCDNAMLEGVASLLGHASTRTTRRYTGHNNALALALTTKGDSVVEALIS